MRRLALALAALLLLCLPGTAIARDRDRDGLPDRWEKKHKLSTKRSSANADRDRDKVDNWNEWREGTNPRRRDSDRDGRPDGREDRDRDGLDNAGEDATGNDPRDRDSDDDGVRDGKERPGTVRSFANGALTIDLAVGGSITGIVADLTTIKCISERASERRHRRASARAAESAPDLGDDEELAEDELGDDDFGWGDDEDLDGAELGDDEGTGREGGPRRCTEAALKRGAKVRKARLDLSEDGLVFERIEILR